jgi:iron complex transport system ATP-binding protein
MTKQTENEIVFTTTGLSVGFGEGKNKNTLLENLDITLLAGQLVCFMGPNGIGKSTLIRTLAGIQKPIKGDIHFTSNEIHTKQLAVVLTDKVTAINLSVYELIAFGRYPYMDWTIRLSDQDKNIIDSAIADVNIHHLIHKKLYELSDGQLQMAMIARAMAQDGDIILLDEPTAHLDLNNRVEIMNLLRRLCHVNNKAILVALHELDLALQMADVIWLAGKDKTLRKGIPEDLVLDGSFDEIFRFKGFDLRTGKIQHDPHRGVSISVTGAGPELLWTRNALERNGFEISDHAKISIHVEKQTNTFLWTLSHNHQRSSFPSISSLINALQ